MGAAPPFVMFAYLPQFFFATLLPLEVLRNVILLTVAGYR